MVARNIHDLSQLAELINASINDDSSYEYIIKKGYDKNLERLRELIHNSQSKIMELENNNKKQRSNRLRYDLIMYRDTISKF